MDYIVSMQIRVRPEETHMDKHRIMGNRHNSNNNTLSNKPLHMDKWVNNNNMLPHINKVMLNKVTLHTEILMANNSTTLTVKLELEWGKWDKEIYHLQERNKCHFTELLHNLNLMVQLDRRIHQKK